MSKRKDPPSPIPFPDVLARFQEDPTALAGTIPGVFLADKPEDMTSHDVVTIARRQLGLRRIGHGGTLDPMATGLLLLLAGNATRLFDAMQEFHKTYITTLQFGIRTDTQDRTGTVLETAPPDALPVSEETYQTAVASFRGEILQTPPMHSALKKNGVPLYKLARQGKTVERDARPVHVYALETLAFDGHSATIRLDVSKGFYVRTFVDDLGQAVGTGATMTALQRTAIGPFLLENATSPDALATQQKQEPII